MKQMAKIFDSELDQDDIFNKDKNNNKNQFLVLIQKMKTKIKCATMKQF